MGRCSVRRYVLLGTIRVPPLDHPVRGKSSIANLVEQRAIADAQCARRLLAVPVTILQNFQDDFPPHLATSISSCDLIRHLPRLARLLPCFCDVAQTFSLSAPHASLEYPISSYRAAAYRKTHFGTRGAN